MGRMSMADNPYRLDILGPARSNFLAIVARLSGQYRKETLAVMARIVDRLRLSPLEFGEELFDLRSLGLQVRLGIQLPLAVGFGVNHAHRIVIIQSVTMLG